MTQEGYLTVSRRELDAAEAERAEAVRRYERAEAWAEEVQAERDQLKADVRFYLKRIKELREKLAQVLTGSPPSPPASTSAVQQP